MASTPELTALDKAELEVNRVLEQIGRIFAAANASQTGTALAVATRMKQVLPASAHNFHNALDELDQQLQLAKSIIRRDLALLNDDPTKRTEITQADNIPQSNGAPRTSSDNGQAVTIVAEPGQITTDLTNAVKNINTDTVQPVKTDQEQPSSDEASKATANHDTDMKGLASTQQQPLMLDTNQADTTIDDTAQKAPDTAFSTNADMDSLFDDTNTTGDPANGNDVVQFNANGDGTNDFDFGVFDANLDSGNQDADMAALMQKYNDTNGQEGAEPDFSALFGSTTGQGGDTLTDGQAEGQPLDPDQDIFNFDDIMDIGINTNDESNTADGGQQEDPFTIDVS